MCMSQQHRRADPASGTGVSAGSRGTEPAHSAGGKQEPAALPGRRRAKPRQERRLYHL
jgi:hypothetical protein